MGIALVAEHLTMLVWLPCAFSVQGMHPMMGNMGGLMGMGQSMAGRGPVPPPKPPPRSPPHSRSSGGNDSDFRSLMNGSMRGRSENSRSREEEIMMRALELANRGRSPRRERRYRLAQNAWLPPGAGRQ